MEAELQRQKVLVRRGRCNTYRSMLACLPQNPYRFRLRRLLGRNGTSNTPCQRIKTLDQTLVAGAPLFNDSCVSTIYMNDLPDLLRPPLLCT